MTDLLEKSAAATEVVEAVCAKRNDAEHDSVPMAPEKNGDVECLGIPTLSPEQQKILWRKIDMRILPVLSALYLCCYLDRGMSAVVT